ncbi:acyl-CoA dehydrogenase family protein, partial [Conexibacter sp. CPCC 205706]
GAPAATAADPREDAPPAGAPASKRVDAPPARAAPGGLPRVRDGRLTAAPVVPDAEKLDWIALAVAGDGIVLLERSQFTLEEAAEIDPSRPLARVRIDDLDVTDRLLPAPAGGFGVAHATAAAELVGLADALLRMSVAYAGERQQFGVAIGSFQALKHRLADVHIAVERARSHVWHAAVLAQTAASAPAIDASAPVSAQSAPAIDASAPAIDTSAPANQAAHFAKAAAADAVTAAARAAVQVHGGIGITAEHDVSLLYLRARQAAFALGSGDDHYLAAIAHEVEPAHAG